MTVVFFFNIILQKTKFSLMYNTWWKIIFKIITLYMSPNIACYLLDVIRDVNKIKRSYSLIILRQNSARPFVDKSLYHIYTPLWNLEQERHARVLKKYDVDKCNSHATTIHIGDVWRHPQELSENTWKSKENHLIKQFVTSCSEKKEKKMNIGLTKIKHISFQIK